MRVPGPGPTRLPLTILLVLWLPIIASRLAGPAAHSAQPADAVRQDEPRLPPPLRLDDAPKPLPPEKQRTEAEQDRVDALALFATGRTLQREGRDAEALRRYQRALRYDPEAETVARAIVRLAVQLDRLDEAARVALKVKNPEAFDPKHLMELSGHLMKRAEWQQAAAIYEKLLRSLQDAERTFGGVALRMEMGRLYHALGEYAKAADCFARVREALEDPQKYGLDEAGRDRLLGEPGPTYLQMGECFLESKRLDDAVAAFEKAHQLESDEALLSYQLARVDAQAGKPAEALAKLQASFDKRLARPGIEPYRLLARLLKELGKEDELVSRLEKLHADDPENAFLGYYLAQTYRTANQLEKAESLYRALLQKSPTLTGYRSLVAIYRETNRPEPLLKILGEAGAKGVRVDSLGAEGRSITEDADLVRTLIKTARKQLQEDPDQFGYDLRQAVALLAMEGRQFEAASQFFDLAIQAKPDQASEILFGWGFGLLSKERHAEAARVFQRGIDQKASAEVLPAFHYYLATALELEGRTDEALAAARKAAELNKDAPDFPDYLGRVAWVLYHGHRRQEATEAYRELIDKFDSDFSSPGVRKAMRDARMALSNLAVLAGDLPQAEEWLEQVLDEFPDDVSALNDLGYLWADRNVRLQRAYRMIRQAVEDEPDNAAYRDSLGWVFYRSNRPDEAVTELEQAAASDPDPVILDHLGDAYGAVNQPDKAKDAWQRAVKAFKERGETEQAEKVQKKIGKEP